MKKTFPIVMLPTEKASDLFIGKTHNKLHYKNTTPDENCKVYQHLYILSDDEIKEGDWLIGGANDESKNEVWKHDGLGYISKKDKKIVATTDKSLIIKYNDEVLQYMNNPSLVEKTIPQIPESFIQAYIKAYNEGKPITEVDLEMEVVKYSNSGNTADILENGHHGDIHGIKTHPDNTVIVHQSKMYTRDETANRLREAVSDAIKEVKALGLNPDETWWNKFTDKWIQDNLS